MAYSILRGSCDKDVCVYTGEPQRIVLKPVASSSRFVNPHRPERLLESKKSEKVLQNRWSWEGTDLQSGETANPGWPCRRECKGKTYFEFTVLPSDLLLGFSIGWPHWEARGQEASYWAHTGQSTRIDSRWRREDRRSVHGRANEENPLKHFTVLGTTWWLNILCLPNMYHCNECNYIILINTSCEDKCTEIEVHMNIKPCFHFDRYRPGTRCLFNILWPRRKEWGNKYYRNEYYPFSDFPRSCHSIL